jgi:hypothetical protein
VEVPTAAGWSKKDRKIMYDINPVYGRRQADYVNKDKRMLLKRREGTIMKNLALQQNLEVANRRTDKELRKLLF